MFSNVSGPQWTTDGNNDLENGMSNDDINRKGGKKGNNNNNNINYGFVVNGWGEGYYNIYHIIYKEKERERKDDVIAT